MEASAIQTLIPSVLSWLNFFLVTGAILLGLVAVLIWAFYFRKNKRKRKRKHRHHRDGKSQINPTLAEKGGLPPIRKEPEDSAGRPPPFIR